MNRTSTGTANSVSIASLTGIVLAAEPARCIRIRTWLEARHSTLQLHIAPDARALNRALCLGNTDFVIIVVPSDESPLPNALRRVKYVHSLVLVETAGIGALPDWLYQGADAVCSLRNTDALRRSLDTLIDVCTLRRRLTLLRAPDSLQLTMLRGLMSAQAAAPSVLANGSRLALRAELPGTTHPLVDPAGTVDTIALRSWQALAVHEQAPPVSAATSTPPDRAGSESTQPHRETAKLGSKRSEIALRRSRKEIARERRSRVANREAAPLLATVAPDTPDRSDPLQ